MLHGVSICIMLTGCAAPQNGVVQVPSKQEHMVDDEQLVKNGQVVLAGLTSAVSGEQEAAKAIVGREAIFVGSALPPGANADLLLDKNIVLHIEMNPDRDVRPHAVSWEAQVSGTVKALDFKNRTIYIVTSPDKWQIRETQ